MMLALSPILIGLSMFLLMAVCVLLILTILIQRPQGGGLSGAFGSGAGSGQTAFGTKTGDALTIFTIIMFVAFVLCSILLVFVTRPGEATLGPPTVEQAPADAPGAAPADPAGTAPAEGTGTAPTGQTPAPTIPPPVPTDQPPATNPAPADPAPAQPGPAPAPATPPGEPAPK